MAKSRSRLFADLIGVSNIFDDNRINVRAAAVVDQSTGLTLRATTANTMSVANTQALVNARLGATSSITLTGAITGSGSFSSNTVSITTSSGTGINAATLDSLDSTQFLRSDAADTKTSGDLSFADNVAAIFGAGSDLQIYHDGSHSYIKDNGTGDLILQGSDQVKIQTITGETMVSTNENNAVVLYYDNAAKLATTSTGIDVTGNATFADNGKAIFGASNDLQIYHDGSNSYISEGGTGNLFLGATNMFMRSSTGETYIGAVQDGAVTLYYDNAAKLATTSTGISITGDATFADNGKAIFGAGSDLQIYHDGSNSYIYDAGTGSLGIHATNLNLKDATGAETYATFVKDGAATLYYDNATKLATTSTGIDVTGTVTADDNVTIAGTNPKVTLTDTDGPYESRILQTGSNTEIKNDNGGNIRFFTGSNAEVLRLAPSYDIQIYDGAGTNYAIFDASTQRLGLGTTSPTELLHIYRSGADASILVRTQGASAGTYHAAKLQFELGASASSTRDWDIVADDPSNNGGYLGVEYEGSEKFRINSSGNVGIGTASVDEKLDVNGNVKFTGTGRIIKFDKNGSGEDNAIYYDNSTASNNLYIGRDSSNLAFRTGAIERMRIDSSGNVGIGTSSPRAKAEVYDSSVSGTFNANDLSTWRVLQIRNNIEGGAGTAAGIALGGDGSSDTKTAGIVGISDNTTGGICQLAFLTATGNNSTEAMRIDSSGRVGIGTTSPSVEFEIASSAPQMRIKDTDTNAIFQINASSTGGGVQLQADATDVGSNPFMLFSVGNSEKIRIVNSGNVGIGTASPSQKAHIYGGSLLIDNGSSAGTIYLHDTTNYINLSGDELQFANNGAERMRITSDGLIDIKKQINQATLPNTPSNHALTFYPPTTTGYFGGGISWSEGTNTAASINAVDAGSGGALHLAFSTGSNTAINERMRIDSSGNVKIDNGSELRIHRIGAGYSQAYAGISMDSSETIVYKNSWANKDFRFTRDGNLLVGRTDAFASTATSGGGSVFNADGLIEATKNGTVAMFNRNTTTGRNVEFRQGGSIVGDVTTTASGTTYNTTSDIRLKTDIAPIADATDKLMAMNAVTHKWKAEPDADAVHGFIAQEMAEIVPEAVSAGDDEDAMMSMDYGRITPVIVAALQDALKEIDMLKDRIAELEVK